MTSKAALLLRNLLARLDADAATEKPQFRGVVSDAERDAMRSLLEGAGNSPTHSPPEAVQESPKTPTSRYPKPCRHTEHRGIAPRHITKAALDPVSRFRDGQVEGFCSQ